MSVVSYIVVYLIFCRIQCLFEEGEPTRVCNGNRYRTVIWRHHDSYLEEHGWLTDAYDA